MKDLYKEIVLMKFQEAIMPTKGKRFPTGKKPKTFGSPALGEKNIPTGKDKSIKYGGKGPKPFNPIKAPPT
jgi:hypothetical protein